MKTRRSAKAGFSTAELLVVLALGAVILGGIMVTFGTVMNGRATISESVQITLDSPVAESFYAGSSPHRRVSVAPNYGALANAEKLREEFNRDVLASTGVFCLYRKPGRVVNPYRLNHLPYNVETHGTITSSLDFYNYLVSLYPAFSDYFEVPLNPTTTNVTPASHASIYLTTFGTRQDRMAILAIYEMDVIKFDDVKPWGFYGSVRKYSHQQSAENIELQNAVLTGGYEVFYQPSVRNPATSSAFSTDGFTPLFIHFERAVRRAYVEDSNTGRDRFKVAAGMPFYFVWWPDPMMSNLANAGTTGIGAADPRRAYNHMGGRTSFMFTVPVFPAL